MKNILEEIGEDVQILSQAELIKAKRDAENAVKKATEEGVIKSKEQETASLEATYKNIIEKQIKDAKNREKNHLEAIKLASKFEKGDKVEVVSLKNTKKGYGFDKSVMVDVGKSFIVSGIGEGFVMNEKGYAYHPSDIKHYVENQD